MSVAASNTFAQPPCLSDPQLVCKLNQRIRRSADSHAIPEVKTEPALTFRKYGEEAPKPLLVSNMDGSAKVLMERLP